MSLRTPEGKLVVAKVAVQHSSKSVYLEANQLESLVLMLGAEPGTKLKLEWVTMTDAEYDATCDLSEVDS